MPRAGAAVSVQHTGIAGGCAAVLPALFSHPTYSPTHLKPPLRRTLLQSHYRRGMAIISLICNVQRTSEILERVFRVFGKEKINVQVRRGGAVVLLGVSGCCGSRRCGGRQQQMWS